MRRVPIALLTLLAATGGTLPSTVQASVTRDQASVPRDVASVLTLGTVLPDTGTLAAYGPATQAAVQLAVTDANAAGGVMGSDVVLRPGNSGGLGGSAFAKTLARLADAQAVIGPLSSALVLENRPAVAGRTLISPAATSPRLSGVLARTVPVESQAGPMLATLAKRRGAVRLVVVGPREQRPLIDATLDHAAVLGLSATAVEFTSRQSTASIAGRIVRASADAMLLASGAETTGILRELLRRGMPAQILLTSDAVDGVDARQLRRGTLNGALALELDLRVPRALASRVTAMVPGARQTAYSAQAYDAAALAILAAEASGRLLGEITSEGVRAALPDVANVGVECDTLARCLRLIGRGVDIDYVGYAGPYALGSDGDPGMGRYLVRTFGSSNKPGSAARPVTYP